jgi:Nucleotidyl transferase AbiEii toxin, Type IV TA system
MLYIKTVESYTFSILEQLMEMPELASFSLVGGTALSLLYGHRMSEDLDFFSGVPFENATIIIKKKIQKQVCYRRKATTL